MTKKVTIEQLAGMVQRGFEGTRKDIQGIQLRLDTVEETLGQRIDTLGLRMESVEIKLSTYASQWNQDFDHLDGWVKDHERRIKVIENP